MKLHLTVLSCAALFSLATACLAQMPPMPGMTNGDGDPANNGMKHSLVAFGQGASEISVHAEEPPATPVTMASGFGVNYASEFDVLEDRYFNSQYGWLPGGILVPPAGSEVWIKRSGKTMPDGATLKVYEGGRGMEMASWTMDELYANDGDIWLWDRVMQHDLYVADKPGQYTMSFEVYFGDAVTGEPMLGYAPGAVTFAFNAVPSPTSLALLTLAPIVFAGRKR